MYLVNKKDNEEKKKRFGGGGEGRDRRSLAPSAPVGNGERGEESGATLLNPSRTTFSLSLVAGSIFFYVLFIFSLFFSLSFSLSQLSHSRSLA